jgi:mannose-6-phosphate isomerase-like protein (cupin superfamily)
MRISALPAAALTIALVAFGGSSGAHTDHRATTTARHKANCVPGVTGVHRYVVAAAGNGTSYTQFSDCDLPASAVGGKSFGAGVQSTALWATNQIPVDNSGTVDLAKRGNGFLGGNASTSLSLISFDVGKSFLHRTKSIDYWVILKGQITLITDKGNIKLTTGDVLINRGGDHAWYRPKGSPPALAITVSISAKPRPGKGTLAGGIPKH